MITPYTSQQPVDDFGLRFANLLYNVSLAATTDTTLTIPGGLTSTTNTVSTNKITTFNAGTGTVSF